LMPGTVGGRSAHPPKADRIWDEKINEKENRKAIRSAMAATIVPELIKARGHRVPKEFPFIIDSKAESIAKTQDVYKALEKLGFTDELARTDVRKIRAGKGKNRGRPYQGKKGPLFVVSQSCALQKAARNIPGIEIATVNQLNAKLLAPGTQPGRLTLWTEAAIDVLTSQKTFTQDYKGETPKAKEVKVVAKKPTPAKKTAVKKSK
ncbi:MAG TPA: 50S ribosomal protein L4, partial [Candidatus Nanoarchaeia archaeon]|nr:50S ribosomal protein L4 [Candidatus Nanoarchaeia archaeon]